MCCVFACSPTAVLDLLRVICFARTSTRKTITLRVRDSLGGRSRCCLLYLHDVACRIRCKKYFLSAHEARTVSGCCMHAGWHLSEAPTLPHPDRTSENELFLFVSPLDPLVPFVERALWISFRCCQQRLGYFWLLASAAAVHWISADKIATQYPSGAT